MAGATPNVTVMHTIFDECSAKMGGAIYQGGTGVSTLTVTNSKFINNYTEGGSGDPLLGGAAFASKAATGSTSSFTNCIFKNNVISPNFVQFNADASSDGGCILFRSANGNFTFNKCSFDNIGTASTGYDKGQDFYLDKGTSLTGSITNCTFGTSTNANNGNKVNIYNLDLAAADVTITNSNTWTFTGTSFTTTNALAPVWMHR